MTTKQILLCISALVAANPSHAQQDRWQPPPEDMSVPSVHPLTGFDGPCPTPAGNLLCAHKTYLGCFQSRNPGVCAHIGYPLKERLGEAYDARIANGPTYYDQAWTMPFSELTDFFQYRFHGFRLVDEDRVSGLDSYNASRLLNTYEVMSTSADRLTPEGYKHSVFYRQVEDGSWRFAGTMTWTFNLEGLVRCNGDPACDPDGNSLPPW